MMNVGISAKVFYSSPLQIVTGCQSSSCCHKSRSVKIGLSTAEQTTELSDDGVCLYLHSLDEFLVVMQLSELRCDKVFPVHHINPLK